MEADLHFFREEKLLHAIHSIILFQIGGEK
jgi:hypothetical protein